MNSEAVCGVPRCAALRTHGDFCAVHVNMRCEAYRVYCGKCARAIRAGTWHTHVASGRFCYPKCKEILPHVSDSTPARP